MDVLLNTSAGKTREWCLAYFQVHRLPYLYRVLLRLLAPIHYGEVHFYVFRALCRYLGYTMVGPVIKGIQSSGVIANAKVLVVFFLKLFIN